MARLYTRFNQLSDFDSTHPMKQLPNSSNLQRVLLAVGVVALLAAGTAALWIYWPFNRAAAGRGAQTFSGEQAYQHVLRQMEFGPRVVGTDAHRLAGEYIVQQLEEVGWQVEAQPFEYDGIALRNFIARVGQDKGPVVIIGAHYDSRRYADQDPAAPLSPVPGANDGASGVAVLLELARTLDIDKLDNEVWLAFFDAEDDGGINNWPWIIGSSYMADNLTVEPEYVVVVDMIGDASQDIYIDNNSNVELSGRIWTLAASLGYGQQFIPVPKYSMLDDHTPFAQLGIPAVDIIDFDYPYWHTTADTADKVSADSLERVGRTVEVLLEGES